MVSIEYLKNPLIYLSISVSRSRLNVRKTHLQQITLAVDIHDVDTDVDTQQTEKYTGMPELNTNINRDVVTDHEAWTQRCQPGTARSRSIK